MEPTQCSETSAFNTQTPGKYPEDNLSLQQHGKSLKTKAFLVDSYAICQEIHPFYGNEEPTFVFREDFCWSPS
jgi:hypothetical protein